MTDYYPKIEYRDEEEAIELGYIRQEVKSLSGGTNALATAVGFQTVTEETPTEPKKTPEEIKLAEKLENITDSDKLKELTKKITPEGFDLAKETETGFVELRKKSENLKGGKIKQEIVDAWRKELITRWVKSGNVELKDVV